jgi:hypothetical protein
MYVQAVFNAQGLFQHVGGWLKQTKQDDKKPIQELLFHASCAFLAISRIEFLKKRCEEQFDEYRHRLGETHDRIAFFSPAFLEALVELSPAFVALRLAQNDLLPAVGKALKLKCEIATSMNDACKKKKIKSYGLPEMIVERTLAYWHNHGKKLKDYRDIDQHQYSLADHAFMQIQPERKLVVLLPDEPTKKERKDATYNQEINALEFLKESFKQLHQYVDDVARLMGYQPVPLEASLWHGAGDVPPAIDAVWGLVIPGTLTGKPFVLKTTAMGEVKGEWLDA